MAEKNHMIKHAEELGTSIEGLLDSLKERMANLEEYSDRINNEIRRLESIADTLSDESVQDITRLLTSSHSIASSIRIHIDALKYHFDWLEETRKKIAAY